MKNNTEWLNERLAHFKGLKRPNDAQQLFMALTEKAQRTPEEEAKFEAVIRVLKAEQANKNAKAHLRTVIRDQKAKEAKAIQKARTHELIQSALLLVAAGLVDNKTGKLTINEDEFVGAMLGIASLPEDHEKRGEWRRKGQPVRQAYLQREEAKKEVKSKPQKNESGRDSNKTEAEAHSGGGVQSNSNYQQHHHQRHTQHSVASHS